MSDRRRTDPHTGEIVDDPTIRPFAEFLIEQDGGRTHVELGESLWDLVHRVEATGKKGSLTLTIVVEPVPKTDATILAISDSITLKLPEFPRNPSVAYVDREGNLTRTNPHQPVLTGLVDVSNPEPTNLKEAK